MSFIVSFNGNLDVKLYDIVISNESDINIYPEMIIKKVDNGDIKITNINTSQVFEINNMTDDETVYIDNDKEIVNPYLGERFDYKYLQLIRGVNTLRTDGNCHIRFRYRHKYLPQTGGEVDDN